MFRRRRGNFPVFDAWWKAKTVALVLKFSFHAGRDFPVFGSFRESPPVPFSLRYWRVNNHVDRILRRFCDVPCRKVVYDFPELYAYQ